MTLRRPSALPTSAMVRRACFESLGGFSTRPKQMGDFEVWLRLCRFYDVGFVERELSDYRVQPADGTSVTAVTKRTGRDWLDELWILEVRCQLGNGDQCGAVHAIAFKVTPLRRRASRGSVP